MLPTAVRHASQAHAAQQDARHDAAHMVAVILFSGGDQSGRTESIGEGDSWRSSRDLGIRWENLWGTRVGEGTAKERKGGGGFGRGFVIVRVAAGPVGLGWVGPDKETGSGSD